MHLSCPACGLAVETADRVPGQAIYCPGCARLVVAATEPLAPEPVRPVAAPTGAGPEEMEVDLVALGLADPWGSPRRGEAETDLRLDEGTTTRLLENRRLERIKRGVEPPDPEDLIGDEGVGPSRSRGRGVSGGWVDPPREPWFYRFLEFTANAMIVFFFVGALALVSIPVLVMNDLLGMTGGGELFGWRLLGPGIVLVMFLVGLLFNLAFILLIVDAARNLRAINLRLAHGGTAGESRVPEGRPRRR